MNFNKWCGADGVNGINYQVCRLYCNHSLSDAFLFNAFLL